MYQKIVVVGNVGNDPEMRYTPNGVAVTSFSLANNETWKNQAGEKQEKTTWFRVTFWRGSAESVAQWVKKGDRLLVEGKVEAHAYINKAGEAAASLELTANHWEFTGSKRDAERDPARDDEGHAAAGLTGTDDLDAPF
jgi:single-strand DNA-binding protein